MRYKLGYDDSLDAFGVHGIGGMLGALLTGVFASHLINPGHSGLIDGNPMQVVIQLKSIGVSIAFCAAASFILLSIIKAVVGLRVEKSSEMEGLDLTEHGEDGYHLGDIPLGGMHRSSRRRLMLPARWGHCRLSLRNK